MEDVRSVRCPTCRVSNKSTDSIKVFGIDFTNTGNACPVCLEGLACSVVVAKCGHAYCEECWDSCVAHSYTPHVPPPPLVEGNPPPPPPPPPLVRSTGCIGWRRDAPDYTEPRGEQEFSSNYSLRGMTCGWGCGNVASSWVRRNATRGRWRACCAAPPTTVIVIVVD